MSEENNPAAETTEEPQAVVNRFPTVEELEAPEYSEDEFSELMALYDESLAEIDEGQIVSGVVLSVEDRDVLVDVGFKSEGSIPVEEFGGPEGVSIGDQVDVFLESIENQDGQIVLSKSKADFMKVWHKIKHAYDSGDVVIGRPSKRIKGGLMVDLMGVSAFLPGSQVALRQVRDFDQYITKDIRLRIIKINKNRRNIVVSRRMVLEDERARMREEVLHSLKKGQIREGTVKNITDFGAFIDLGGVDGLLHITDMSWGRVSHPSEIVNISDVVQVKVLDFNEAKDRISLGLKQLQPYPWRGVEERYPIGAKVMGKVVSITDYGAFVELEEGIEGLVHISEMSWTQHIRHPSKVVTIGDEIEVVVLRVNAEEEKISLGLKQTEPDPWETLEVRFPVGTKLAGTVRNLTNFGAFVEIEPGIDGLVHISDLSWTRRIRHPSEMLNKGDELEVVILSIDKDQRRISLGHKQTRENPWDDLADQYEPGVEATGTIVRLVDKGVIVDLGNEVEGFVPVQHLGRENLESPEQAFDEGDEVPLTVIEFDKSGRKIVLSATEYFKSKDQSEQDAFLKKHEIREPTLADHAGGSDLADLRKQLQDAEEDDASMEVSADSAFDEVEVPEDVDAVEDEPGEAPAAEVTSEDAEAEVEEATPAIEETADEEAAVAIEEAAVEEATPAIEEAEEEEATPAIEEAEEEEATPAIEETADEEAAVAIEETSSDDEVPATGEISAEEEVSAEEETSTEKVEEKKEED